MNISLSTWRDWPWRIIFGLLAAAVFFSAGTFGQQYAVSYFLQGMALLSIALVLPDRKRP